MLRLWSEKWLVKIENSERRKNPPWGNVFSAETQKMSTFRMKL
jgi:hypothetical protein